jgi:hypothetical protein
VYDRNNASVQLLTGRCDLKQNSAVWQPYALDDFHFSIDCVFEALSSAPAKPCGLFKTTGRREIARVSKVLRQIALAAKICFQTPATRGCVHSTNE